MLREQPPIGVILAGGRGARMGGSKLTAGLHGRPLLDYPLQAMRAALPDVAVIAKADVELPTLEGVMLWIEPDEPRHPLVGIVEALALAGGRSIVTCPADLPFVTPALIRRLAEEPADGAPAVIAACGERLQPLLGRYLPAAGELLADAARRATDPVRQAVAAIRPRLVEVSERELFNVNYPEDLLHAAAVLDRTQPKVKS